jgi:PAS domain S-box-containing protein
MPTPLRVLIVEDTEADARLVVRALAQGGYDVTSCRVDSAPAMKQALADAEWDIVLSDHMMPTFSAPQALELLRASGRDLPFIVVSSAIGDEAAATLMRAGAHDYVMKDRLSRLALAVDRELKEAESRRERRAAETALRASEERYRTLAETAHDFIFMVGPDLRVQYVNSTAAAEVGRQPDELKGKSIAELFPGPTGDRQAHNLRRVFESGSPLYLQNRSVFPKRELWLDTWLAPIRDAQGKVQSVVGISRNVTELIQIELALRSSEERYRLLFENAPVGIYRTAPDGRILMANPALIQMFGCSSFYELYTMNLEPDRSTYDRREFLAAIERAGEIRGYEARDLRRDGTTIFVRENARAQRDAEGKTLYYEGTVEDISDQRRVQARLAESETRYREIFERALDIIYVHDLQGRFLAINPAGEKLLGYTRDQLCRMTIDQVIDPDFLPIARQHMQDKIAGKTAQTEYELMVRTRTGEQRRIELVSRIVFKDGKPDAIQGNARDITDRRAAEAAVRESEQRFRTLFQDAPVPIGIARNGINLDVNQAYASLFGYQRPDELLGKPLLQLVAPEERDRVRTRTERLGASRPEPATNETIGLRADGTRFPLLVHAVRLQLPDGPATVGYFTDLTQARRADLKVRQSEERYRNLVELSPDAIAVHAQGKVIYANPAALRLMRADTPEQVVGRALLDFVHPDYRDFIAQRVRATAGEQRQVPLAEEKFIRLDGSVIDVEVAAMPISFPLARDGAPGPDADVPAVLVVFRDVTERKQNEIALRQSEARYRLLFEATPIGIAVFHPDGTVIAVNQFMQDLSGYAFTDFKQLGIGAVFVDPDERNRLLAESGGRNLETQLRRKDGTLCFALLNVDRLEFGGHTILLATARDITDRKLAELRLVRLNQLYAVLSQANQTFVRIRDSAQLCQEACRILVEAGGYRAAWVGVIDRDRRELKPIARAGEGAGFVARLRISLDAPGDRGPAATALREDRSVVRADAVEAPGNMPFHTEALELGFRAAAAFPLRIEDEVIGALSIYAGEPGFFDDEQVHLLEALAADLSFALQSVQFQQLREAEPRPKTGGEGAKERASRHKPGNPGVKEE